MLRKDYQSKYSTETKLAGCEYQEACRQDELFGGKLPIVK
jgi:hypothetical protein